MFGLSDFWDKSLVIFENFEIALSLLGQFQNFQKSTREFIPDRPPKHVITSTNLVLLEAKLT